jgi:hypothetical protein
MAGRGNNSAGYVYIVKYLDEEQSRDGEQMFKVGTSTDPDRRIDELTPGMKELVCQYYFEHSRFKVETFLKARLKCMKFIRVKGTTEYFYGDYEMAVGILRVLHRDKAVLFPLPQVETLPEFTYDASKRTELCPEWCEMCQAFTTKIHIKFGHKK